MDILNFIHWLRERRVVTSAPADSLLAIGVPDPRRDDKYLTCAIKASDLGLGEGGSTTGEYRMSQFADTIIPRTDFDESIVGKFFDVTGGKARFFGSGVFVELENGNLAFVYYNQTVLESGILIYEAYEILPPNAEVPVSYIDGYWIAYKQDPFNKERLIKIGELQMTQQFWNNWYNYTAKDSGPNAVKFVSTDFNLSVSNSVESYITKLTWTGSELVAEDIYFDFDGETFQSLYSTLTGITVFDDVPAFELRITEYILDDDYYGMAMGAEKGWCFYRNANAVGTEEPWITVGYNILTGETKWVNPIPIIITLNNLDLLDPGKFVMRDWVNHPGGLVYSFSDDKVVDNGDNNDGVTAIWSPYWESNTECIYLGIREQSGFSPTDAIRMLTDGNLNPVLSTGTIFSYYWDNKAFYFWTNAAGFNDQVYIVHKYHIETKEVTSYTLPYLSFLEIWPPTFYNHDITNYFLQSWANNDGLLLNVTSFNQLSSWSMEKYQYVKHEDSKIYKFHLDMSYPSHAFKDKIYNINTMASYNFDTLGVAISTYKKMKF
jgi:hypothetical protein